MGEERAVAMAALAEQDRLEGKLDSARERADAALALFEARENPRGITEMKLLLTSIAIHRRDIDSASKLLADLGADLGNVEQRAMWHVRSAQTLLLKGDRAGARDHAGQAITLANESHTAQVKVEAELELAMASPRQEGLDLLAQAEADLAGFASVPLQIRLYSVSQALNRDSCANDHQLGQAILAKLPGFVGALAFHEAASDCNHLESAQRQRAGQQAGEALQRLIDGAAESDRTFLVAYQKLKTTTP
ncbi:MAG: hypothetical protein IPK97_18580 [Ahniella sp.]|nr:hypothetical protein [Ahniella sp.]